MPVTTDGTGVKVGLLPDPFAHQLAYASQMGKFDFSVATTGTVGATLNTIDPRCFLPDPNSNDGDTDFGINLIILNSMTRPLKLVDTKAAQLPDEHAVNPAGGGVGVVIPGGDSDYQVCYPAGQYLGVTHNHEIPAARLYPNTSKHVRPAGGPALFAGLGWYRFDMRSSADNLNRALSFQVGDDTTHHVGVIIRLELRDRGIFRHHASYAFGAVTADLEKEYGDLATFFQYKMPNPHNTPWGPALSSVSDRARGGLTLCSCPIPHDEDRLGTNTDIVWVRDESSTTG